MQIAPVSRGEIAQYRALRREIEGLAGRLNGKYSEFDWTPVRYLNKSFPRKVLAGFYRASKVGFVTPVRDGMNLVAKEYVAAQDPADPGVLVLSRFAGAARELRDALIVNPHDVDEMAAALHTALTMPRDQRIERWRRMMTVLQAQSHRRLARALPGGAGGGGRAIGWAERPAWGEAMREGTQGPALLGDIGATNARFALLDGTGMIGHIRVLACADHAGLAEAAEAYLKQAGAEEAGGTGGEAHRLRAAAIDVAGPVAGDQVALTNHPWSFSQAALKARLGVERLLIVNDFAAVAAAAPHLGMSELGWLGGGTAPPTIYAPEETIGVIGPGSGLGVGCILPVGEGRWMALAGEGGHVSLPPATAREGQVWEAMRQRFGHVSAERALSGPGIVNLYTILAELDGAVPRPLSPAEVTEGALDRHEPHCRLALEMFADILGTVAADLALTLGARGGIYIAGGIVPRLAADFPAARFRARFEDKGRLSHFLIDIPTFVIRHPFPAFVGLAALLRGGSAIAG